MAEEEGQEVIFTENTAPDREIWDEKGGLIKKGAAEIAERDQDHVPEVKVYDEAVYFGTAKWAILEQMKTPPTGFEEVIMAHFREKKKVIMNCVQVWHDKGTDGLKTKLAPVIEELAAEFAKLMTVEDAQQELSEAQLEVNFILEKIQYLEAKVKEVPTDVSALSGGVPLLTHPLPCAGVVYADVLLDLQRLPVSELPLLSLYAALLMQAGTSELDATALQRRIGARTGGIDVGTKLEQPVGDSGAVGAPDGVVHKLVVRDRKSVV